MSFPTEPIIDTAGFSLKALDFISKENNNIIRFPNISERKTINKILGFKEHVLIDVLPEQHFPFFVEGKEILNKTPHASDESIKKNIIKIGFFEKIFKCKYASYIDFYNQYMMEYQKALLNRGMMAAEIQKCVNEVLSNKFDDYQAGLNGLKNVDFTYLNYIKNNILNGELFPNSSELSNLSINFSKEVIWFRYLFVRFLFNVEELNNIKIFSFKDAKKLQARYLVSIYQLGYQWAFINKFISYELSLAIKKCKYDSGFFLPF